MNKEQFMDFHREFCEEMIDTSERKNADYAGAGDDPFNNFRHIGNFVYREDLDVVALGILARMSDKLARIGSFIAKGELQVKDESVYDTLLDNANYSSLLAAYLKSRMEETSPAQASGK